MSGARDGPKDGCSPGPDLSQYPCLGFSGPKIEDRLHSFLCTAPIRPYYLKKVFSASFGVATFQVQVVIRCHSFVPFIKLFRFAANLKPNCISCTLIQICIFLSISIFISSLSLYEVDSSPANNY